MGATDVAAIWRRIEDWLTRNAADIVADLNPPASREAVSDAEQRLGWTLPADVRASFAIHDGQGAAAPWGFPGWRMLPLALAVARFEDLRTLQDQGAFANTVVRARGPLKAVWWSPGWIPLFSNGSGDNLCVDVDPPDGGRVGQVLEYWGRVEQRSVIAPSLTEWLGKYAADLDAGRFGRDEDGSLTRIR
jgi:cell wall assembly regulator SMI1